MTVFATILISKFAYNSTYFVLAINVSFKLGVFLASFKMKRLYLYKSLRVKTYWRIIDRYLYWLALVKFLKNLSFVVCLNSLITIKFLLNAIMGFLPILSTSYAVLDIVINVYDQLAQINLLAWHYVWLKSFWHYFFAAIIGYQRRITGYNCLLFIKQKTILFSSSTKIGSKANILQSTPALESTTFNISYLYQWNA